MGGYQRVEAKVSIATGIYLPQRVGRGDGPISILELSLVRGAHLPGPASKYCGLFFRIPDCSGVVAWGQEPLQSPWVAPRILGVNGRCLGRSLAFVPPARRRF